MRIHINSAYKILTKIFAEGTYSNMALNEENVSDLTTKLVYGVLENNVKIEYILSQLASKPPKKAIAILLKIGIYALTNLDNVPDFAIVSECVEVAKMNGKAGAGGFINAVLKRVARKEYTVPNEGDKNYLSTKYSKPQWFVDKVIEQYGEETAVKIFEHENTGLEHIRVNTRLTTLQDVKKALDGFNVKYKESEVGGLCVRVDDNVKKMFSKGLITYQSPSSMLAVNAMNLKDGANILDLCSAPGGKAVYMSEICPHSVVTACELHEHRVRLIQKYKMRMHTPNVKAVQCDATKFNEEWESTFDFVLVDAPCSCFGTFAKHPDVFLTRTDKDVAEIASTQRKIIKNASNYVKDGGVLLYSTCTLFKEENDDVVADFLESNKEFHLERIDGVEGIPCENNGLVHILPHGEYDGFFIAKMRKGEKL